MGISQRRISYAIGEAAWGSKAASEGLPVLAHFEPEPVTDSSSAPRVAKDSRLPGAEEFSVGAMYYVADVPIAFSPAHASLLLDKLFGDTVAGGSPNYDRTYQAEDVPGEASSPYLNIWKRTAKPGHDHNLCVYNGIVTGITIAQEAGKAVTMTARCAFGARSFDEADPAAWAISWSGNTDPVLHGSPGFYLASVGGGYSAEAVPAFRITLSCEFTPHIYGSQNPDRFSRGRMAMSGEFSLRDKTDEVEAMSALLEESTLRRGLITLGSTAALYFNCNIHAGGGSEDEITRQGRFSLTGVYEKDATYPTGFRLFVRAGRA